MRWRLDIGYDGSGFSGWARQCGLRTIQGEIELAITRVLRLTEPASLVCAGRTDAGVHARGQVAHVDLPPDAALASEPVDGPRLRHRLGRAVPDDVVIWSVSAAPPGFDARFSAIWRRYTYRIMDGDQPLDPLCRHLVTPVRETLDLDRFNTAATSLLGLRDFGAFCRRRPEATTIRTLLDLHATRMADGPLAGSLEITVRADAFCHSMVRSLVGALVAVGSGRRQLDWLAERAATAERGGDARVMPPGGLTLEEVGYPPAAELAARAAEARTRRVPPR